MKEVVFFKKEKFNLIKDFFPNLDLKNQKMNYVKPLHKSKKFDLSFFDSIKYKNFASETKASYCITTKKLEKFLPKTTYKIVVKNVLLELTRVLKKLYPKADIDYPDLSLKSSSASKFKVPWPFEKLILLKTFISPSSLSLSSE